MKQFLPILGLAGILFSSCGASKKLDAANATINSLNGEVAGLNSQVSQLKTENVKYSKEAEDCRKLEAAIQQRYNNLNSALAEKGTSMKQIREKAASDLQKFVDMGADVSYENGLVHINFTDNFFYNSGSYTIATKGREALNTVAQVLRDNPGVTAIIVGHTDDQLPKSSIDNWSISTERANAVVRILHDTYNINPIRLTAAGQSSYHPVADNKMATGREKNRRIEIILNPKLDRLWELSEGK